MRRLASENKCQLPGAGGGRGARPAATRAFMGWRCDHASRDPWLRSIHPSRPFPPAGAVTARSRRDDGHSDLAVLPSSAPYGPPRTLPVPDLVSTRDELSVARYPMSLYAGFTSIKISR